MVKIGLLSDTHGVVDERILVFFNSCDEIWHAGDIGQIQTAEKLADCKYLRAVHGNIDGQDIRRVYPQELRFHCEETDVWITHIGGYPGNYDKRIATALLTHPPGLFISGHSHILKVMYDRRLGFLHINPGAAGNTGLHKVKTAVRFVMDKKNIRELEILELERG